MTLPGRASHGAHQLKPAPRRCCLTPAASCWACTRHPPAGAARSANGRSDHSRLDMNAKVSAIEHSADRRPTKPTTEDACPASSAGQPLTSRRAPRTAPPRGPGFGRPYSTMPCARLPRYQTGEARRTPIGCPAHGRGEQVQRVVAGRCDGDGVTKSASCSRGLLLRARAPPPGFGYGRGSRFRRVGATQSAE